MRREAGEEERMKEPYGEGSATHTDPESCVVVREGAGEALTGAHRGWPRKILIRGADPVGLWGRQHGRARPGEHRHGLAWSQAIESQTQGDQTRTPKAPARSGRRTGPLAGASRPGLPRLPRRAHQPPGSGCARSGAAVRTTGRQGRRSGCWRSAGCRGCKSSIPGQLHASSSNTQGRSPVR